MGRLDARPKLPHTANGAPPLAKREKRNESSLSRFLYGFFRGEARKASHKRRSRGLNVFFRSSQKQSGTDHPAGKKAYSKEKAAGNFFDDNGYVPNNPKFPFLHYRNVVSLTEAPDPAAVFESLFKTNGWTGVWPFHPRGVARGRARVRFGGNRGKAVSLRMGDVIILPAGTGHQALKASKDLLVVGTYPVSGKYDEFRAKALRMISKVRAPTKDPVFGRKGPLKRLWK
jgi:uncharacterized protein YjlB